MPDSHDCDGVWLDRSTWVGRADPEPGVRASRCFVGIDSGLMWIAGALQARTVGLYGTEYLPKPEAVQPVNPNAIYLNSPVAVSEIPAEAVRASLRD